MNEKGRTQKKVYAHPAFEVGSGLDYLDQLISFLQNIRTDIQETAGHHLKITDSWHVFSNPGGWNNRKTGVRFPLKADGVKDVVLKASLCIERDETIEELQERLEQERKEKERKEAEEARRKQEAADRLAAQRAEDARWRREAKERETAFAKQTLIKLLKTNKKLVESTIKSYEASKAIADINAKEEKKKATPTKDTKTKAPTKPAELDLPF